MRIGRFGEPTIESLAPIEVGRGRILRSGTRVCLVSSGGTMVQVLAAADLLAERGMEVAVAHFHTLSPFDFETFDSATRDAVAVVIVEDHGIRGGLASVLLEHVLASPQRLRLVRLGPTDQHVIGNPTQPQLQQRMGYDTPSIAAAAIRLWEEAAGPVSPMKSRAAVETSP